MEKKIKQLIKTMRERSRNSKDRSLEAQKLKIK
jgi:hypothetical protein